MTLQWIPLDRLEPHPDNSNRMPQRLMEKLKGHIQRTGLYEPLVVRPLTPVAARAPTVRSGSHASADETLAAQGRNPELTLGARTGETQSVGARPGATTCYQILNGHHRAEVLRQLGHTHARCDVWNTSDEEALILLATLNRLEGRDDPAARARLVAKLAVGQSAEDLARLLPEPADAVERLLKLAEPPPAPLAPEAAALTQRPMTFFLTEEQHALVREALAEAARPACQCNPSARAPTVRSGSCTSADEALATQGRNPELTLGARTGETHSLGARTRESQAREASPATCSRADAIERLALWYLEARNLR